MNVGLMDAHEASRSEASGGGISRPSQTKETLTHTCIFLKPEPDMGLKCQFEPIHLDY